ncbi:hypothetical protein B0H13DRAFT_2348952 [Mycena leptocephala]|nr:hypothetical protein B0H13DRAFT_2348952 [Mycena leptocephala]
MRVISFFSLLAAVAAPLACAFTIATFTANDPPTFNLFLTNSTNAFDLKEIIGQNLQTNLGQIHTLLPTLASVGGYALHAVNAENVDIILAASPPFAITA